MTIHAIIEQVYTGHSDAVYCLESGRDGREFYSGSGDGFIGSWDLESGTFRKPVASMPATIYSIRRHPTLHLLYAGLRDGVLFALDIDAQAVIKSLKLSRLGIFDLAFLNEGRMIAAATGEGTIHLLDTKEHALIQSIELADASIRSLDISPCGRFMIAGASDNQIYFLKMEGELVLKSVLDAHENSVFTAIYTSGYDLLSGGRDALLKKWTWNLDSEDWQINAAIPAHNFTINRISRNPAGRIFATASRDKSIKIWDIDSLELLKVISPDKFSAGHTHSVNTLMWLDGQTLLSAGDDKKIIRWKVTQE